MEEAPMQPYGFAPWSWRDPAFGPVDPDNQGDPGDRVNVDSTVQDEQQSRDLAAYHVEALDGKIGSIDEATYEVGSASIVVDTGPWIFGHKVLLPAGTGQRVDHGDHQGSVDRAQ